MNDSLDPFYRVSMNSLSSSIANTLTDTTIPELSDVCNQTQRKKDCALDFLTAYLSRGNDVDVVPAASLHKMSTFIHPSPQWQSPMPLRLNPTHITDSILHTAYYVIFCHNQLCRISDSLAIHIAVAIYPTHPPYYLVVEMEASILLYQLI